MKRRKTVNIELVRAKANEFFRNSKEDQRDARNTIHIFVADLLHNTNNYRGFSYLTAKELPDGVKPGVIHDANGKGEHVFPDDSRIHFH